MSKPVLRTPLCDMLGIDYPIISAGMGPTLIGEPNGAPVELVVAVSEAGGLGVLGGAGFTLSELKSAIQEIKSKTAKPFGVDLLLPKNIPGAPPESADLTKEESVPLADIVKLLPEEHGKWYHRIKEELNLPDLKDLYVNMNTTTMHPQEAVKICIDEKVPLFCAGLGDPGFMVEEAHANGIKVLGVVGNAKNAGRVARSGADLIAAQGFEGGGHTGRVGTMALLPQAIDAAAPVPVLAAGGIGDGRGVAAALAMGCIGVWMGTRFLATREGGAMDLCKEKIISSTDEDTRVSTLYTGKTSRASYTKFHDVWSQSGLPALPFPFQVLFASALLDGFIKAGLDDHVGGFAGQVSGLITEIKPAGVVLGEIVEETVDIFKRKLPNSISLS